MIDIQEIVLGDPVLSVALLLAIRTAIAWQRGLTYTELIAAHTIKCRMFGWLNPLASRLGRPLVHVKHYRDEDAEFDRTASPPPRVVASRIRDVFGGHLIATAKRRETPDGLQWSHSQWRQVHGDGTQTEVYLFRNPDGSTDVYVHVEDQVEDPEGHLTDPQLQGDAKGAFASAYEDHPDTLANPLRISPAISSSINELDVDEPMPTAVPMSNSSASETIVPLHE